MREDRIVAKKLLIDGMLNIFLVSVAVMLVGCAGGISIVPMSVKIQNADRKVELARMIVDGGINVPQDVFISLFEKKFLD